MAAIPHWSASHTTNVTATSTSSWTNKLSYTLTAANQEAGEDYAVFWSIKADKGSDVSADWKVRVQQAGSDKASINIEGKEGSSPVDSNLQGGFFIFTAAGTPVDTTFTIDGQVETSGTLNLREAYFQIFKLPANSAWVESTSSQQSTTDTLADKTGASLSLSGEYLLLVCGEMNVAGTNIGGVLAIDVDGTDYLQSGGVSDGSNYFTIMTAVQATVTTTAKVQFAQTVTNATAVNLRNVRLLALKVSDFRKIVTARLNSDDSGSTSTSYNSVLSATDTPWAGEHLVIAAFAQRPSSNTISTYGRLTSGGTSIGEQIRESGTANTPTIPAAGLTRLETYANASRTWAIQRRSESTSVTSRIPQGAFFAVIDLTESETYTPGTHTTSWQSCSSVTEEAAGSAWNQMSGTTDTGLDVSSSDLSGLDSYWAGWYFSKSSADSDWLRTYNFGFDSEIPEGSEINKITVRVWADRFDNHTVSDLEAYLCLHSAGDTTDRVTPNDAALTALTSGGAYIYYEWDVYIPDADDVRSSAFGFDWAITKTAGSGSGSSGANTIHIQIEYTPPPSADTGRFLIFF